MEPIYRDGDTIVISPAADIRRGDRVVVKTRQGEVMAKELARQSARKIELTSLNKDHPDRSLPDRSLPDRSLEVEEIDWMARIVWASQ
jgi:phage repressor protein C with HTH and peptisase S24 domain